MLIFWFLKKKSSLFFGGCFWCRSFYASGWVILELFLSFGDSKQEKKRMAPFPSSTKKKAKKMNEFFSLISFLILFVVQFFSFLPLGFVLSCM